MAQLCTRLCSVRMLQRRYSQFLAATLPLITEPSFSRTLPACQYGTRPSARPPKPKSKKPDEASATDEREMPRQMRTSVIVDMLAGEIESHSEFQTDSQLAEFDNKLQELDKLLRSQEEQVEIPDVIMAGDALSDGDVSDDENDGDYPIDSRDEFDLELDLDKEQTEDAHYLEEIMLDQAPKVKMSLPRDTRNHVNLFGNPDPSEPISDAPCPGCGAFLHCQDPLRPGYISTQRYKSTPQPKLRDTFCHRCFTMRNYNLALGVNVDPKEYIEIISHMRDVQALALLIVDLTDIEGSLIRNLPELIGRKRPLVILGNKVDLLPRDEGEYLMHIKVVLDRVCRSAGLHDDFYVRYTGLVSARTGYGIEELLTILFRNWSRRGHVYLLGCTNVGKSSLFNALLSSDYCKATSRDLIHRATTSIWPGTTLNLLKFPVMAPEPSTLRKRLKRLKQEGRRNVHMIEERKLQEKRQNPTRVLSMADRVGQTHLGMKASILENHHESVHGYIGSTYTFNEKTELVGETELDHRQLQHQVFGDREIFDESLYEQSQWCHDTPGLVNPDQLINILNQEELSLILPKISIIPRTFVLHPGKVMLIGGLGRIDYNEGPKMSYFTVFACRKLPIHVVTKETADDFYREHIGTDTLKVPCGDPDRLNRIPSLVGCEFAISGLGWTESGGDVVLSSLGWVAITTSYGRTVHLRAYTPGGRGCYMRSHSLLKHCINQKSHRIGGTAEYKRRSSKKPPAK